MTGPQKLQQTYPRDDRKDVRVGERWKRALAGGMSQEPQRKKVILRMLSCREVWRCGQHQASGCGQPLQVSDMGLVWGWTVDSPGRTGTSREDCFQGEVCRKCVIQLEHVGQGEGCFLWFPGGSSGDTIRSH